MNARQQRFLLIGPRRKNLASGVSEAFEILVDALRKDGNPGIVDIMADGAIRESGVLRLRRVLTSLKTVLSAWRQVFGATLVYMTLASSRLGFFRDMLIIWAVRLTRRSLVLHLQGGGFGRFFSQQSPAMRALISRTVNQADRIIVLSSSLLQQFQFVDDFPNRLRVVPNGIDGTFAQEFPIPKTLPRDGGAVKLLYLSNLMPTKGYGVLLEACSHLKSVSSLPFECHFCGTFITAACEGENRNSEAMQADFMKRINDCHLSNRVFYHGTVMGAEKALFLRDCHVFILPTAYPWEGQPISIIEAMAAGMPILSTAYQGIPDMLRDGCNGYFIPPSDPDTIASAIERTVSDPQAYSRMSLNSLRRFKEYFTAEKHLQRLLSVIAEVE